MAAASTTASQNSALGWAKILGKIFYLLLALLIVFLIFKSARWNWGLISLFVAVLGYILIFVESDFKRLALFMFITLYFATDFSIGLYRLFTSDDRVIAAIRENTTLTFLLGAPSDRLVWSIILGFILALVLALALLFLLSFISAVYVLALHKMDGVSWWDATLYVISLILGFNSAYMTVENGQAVITKEAAKLGVLGGPGHLVIKQGNVVVLERGGKITRIVNAGVVKLKPMETIRNIFALNVQSSPAETTEIEHVLTKDRIPLTVTAKLAFQIEPASEADKRPESRIAPNGEALTRKLDDGLYQVYEGTVLKAALMSQRLTFDKVRFGKCEEQICRDIQVTEWQKVAGSAPEGELRDYIMSHRFDELFELDDSASGEKSEARVNKRKIYEIEQAILKDIRPKKIAALGVLVRGMDIGKIEFPRGAEQLLLEYWKEPWEQDMFRVSFEGRVKRAELEAKEIVIQARANAQARILEGQGEGEARAAFFREVLREIKREAALGNEEMVIAVLRQLISTMVSVKDLQTFIKATAWMEQSTRGLPKPREEDLPPELPESTSMSPNRNGKDNPGTPESK